MSARLAAAGRHNLKLLHSHEFEFPYTGALGHVKRAMQGHAIRSDDVIPAPYLLYVGNETDELSAKTSRGVAQWRSQLCAGQYRGPASPSLVRSARRGIPRAVERGARTLILGIANAGGMMGGPVLQHVIAALEAGLNIASGLHQRLRDEPSIAAAAQRCGRQLFDVRDPPPGLPVGKGVHRPGRWLLTVGTDCGLLGWKDVYDVGDRAGNAQPRDAGGLSRHGYAGVSLGLLHGAQPDALVLCHQPGRPTMRGLSDRRLPDLKTCLHANLEAARLTNPNVKAVGVALIRPGCRLRRWSGCAGRFPMSSDFLTRTRSGQESIWWSTAWWSLSQS